MKWYTFDEILDGFIGKKGTPERDRFEARAKADVRVFGVMKMLHDKNRNARIKQSNSKTVKIPRFRITSIYRKAQPGHIT